MNLEIIRTLAEGAPGRVLCTVLQVKGSAPRHAGSMMLTGPEGILLGSVGGGRGESLVLAACRVADRPRIMDIDMQGMDVESAAMVCGGTSRILVEPLGDSAPYRMALERLQRGERVLLVKGLDTPVTAVMDAQGRWILGAVEGADPAQAQSALESGHPVLAEDLGLFYAPLLPREKLLILGGGHVGRALAALAPGLGFSTTVGDDREAFLESARFPAGVATLTGTYTQIVDAFSFDPSTYVVIVSRGHMFDLECVRAVLPKPYRYAGFMGSRRKTRLILDQVLAEGFDARKVDALCGPIGLDLGAETPEELAVAIAGELIAVRRNAEGLHNLHHARKARRAAP